MSDASLGYIVFKDSIIKKTDYYDINAMGPAGSELTATSMKWRIGLLRGSMAANSMVKKFCHQIM